MTQSSRDNKYQASSRNEALLAKEKQDQRIHSYTNKKSEDKKNEKINIKSSIKKEKIEIHEIKQEKEKEKRKQSEKI